MSPALSIVDRIAALCAALDRAGLPWALGGALALAYATEEPRGTRDIDINVFVPSTQAASVFAALPRGVRHSAADAAAALSADQVRLWWDDTPVDVFFAASRFHAEVALRCRAVPFAGQTVRVLAAEDLAVFKALFDRSRDWVDIEAMVESDTIDIEVAATRLARLLGDDPRVGRLLAMGTMGG